MTHYGAKELVTSFRIVRGNTITIAEEIPEHQYNFLPSPEARTVGRTLVHIAAYPSLQIQIQQGRVTDLNGFDFMQSIGGIRAEEEKARSKADIVAFLKSEGERFTAFLEGLGDATLAERVTMMTGSLPPSKSRLEMLMTPKEHEMHHRGQLMVMQRMIGIVPHLTRQMQARLAARV